ncbi:MAG: hypothetical protein IKV35_00415 [Clostridia bacterium]|nr:hypothetical protein [Clostridia bacterium]
MDGRQTSLCAYLPESASLFLRRLPSSRFCEARELRLRCNTPPMLVFANERLVFSTPLTTQEVESCFYKLCQTAVHTHQNELAQGFITTADGFRVGIGGQAVLRDGTVSTYRRITSLCIRLSRVFEGCADALLPYAVENGTLNSMLLCGAPSCGKTTLLRDLARSLSQTFQLSVVDERGELSLGGLPLCDVLDGCPKTVGMLQAVRTLSPDGVIVDELGDETDWQAVSQCCWRGVSVIASAHICEESDIKWNPQLRSLIARGGFRIVAILPPRSQPYGATRVWKARDILEDGGDHADRIFLRGDGCRRRLASS